MFVPLLGKGSSCFSHLILNFSENCTPEILTPYLDGIVIYSAPEWKAVIAPSFTICFVPYPNQLFPRRSAENLLSFSDLSIGAVGKPTRIN
jgi:hypothetical protein